MKTAIIGSLCILSSFLACTDAAADGGVFWDRTFAGRAVSDGQQAILFHFDGWETLVLQTEYEGELADFSWLIPVPSEVTAEGVFEADGEIFPWMDRRTAPSYYIINHETDPDAGGCGCDGSDEIAGRPNLDGGIGQGDGVDGGQDVVEVVETILTETYAIDVLSAIDPSALLGWLDEHEYAYPDGTEDVLAHYVTAGWYFLALRINPATLGEEVDQALPPLMIDFEVDELVFPLKISSLSSSPAAEVLIHVVSDHRYRTVNAESREVYYYRDGTLWGYEDEYHAWLLDEVISENGALYWIEYAGLLHENDCAALNDFLAIPVLDPQALSFVTRFRTHFLPELFDEDIRFEPTEYNAPFMAEIIIDLTPPTAFPPRIAAGLILLVPSAIIRRRRSSPKATRLAGLGFALGFLVLLV